MCVLYLPFDHIFMTLYSTACFFFLPSFPRICPITQNLWLTVIRGLTAHKSQEQKGKNSKHLFIQCGNLSCIAVQDPVCNAIINILQFCFPTPLNWSYETFYWIQSCLLSRKNFILLTHELFKNYSIKCWLIVVQFFFSEEKAIQLLPLFSVIFQALSTSSQIQIHQCMQHPL